MFGSRSWHVTIMGAMGAALFLFTGLSFALIGPADRRTMPMPSTIGTCEPRDGEALTQSTVSPRDLSPTTGPMCRADQPACYFDPEAATARGQS